MHDIILRYDLKARRVRCAGTIEANVPTDFGQCDACDALNVNACGSIGRAEAVLLQEESVAGLETLAGRALLERGLSGRPCRATHFGGYDAAERWVVTTGTALILNVLLAARAALAKVRPSDVTMRNCLVVCLMV
jgi:hypothetical protein